MFEHLFELASTKSQMSRIVKYLREWFVRPVWLESSLSAWR